MNKMHTRSSSIFIRLILLQILSGILILGSLWFFMWFVLGSAFEEKKQNYLFKISENVIAELGVVPSYEKAFSISKKWGINISYKGTYGEWSTSQQLSPSKPRTIIARLKEKHHEDFTYLFNNSSGEFFLTFNFIQPPKPRWEWFVLLTGFVVLVLIGNYRLLRRIFKPIEWLMEGVKLVSEGNLEKEIPVLKNDELGKLSGAFNLMSRQVKEMIENKERLLLDVSHELRSPLTRMKVTAEFIADDKIKSDLSEDMLELEKMIEEILEVARLNKKESLADEGSGYKCSFGPYS